MSLCSASFCRTPSPRRPSDWGRSAAGRQAAASAGSCDDVYAQVGPLADYARCTRVAAEIKPTFVHSPHEELLRIYHALLARVISGSLASLYNVTNKHCELNCT